MADEVARGAIRSEDAYALGKMLDHSSWQKGDKVLPRKITGSDVDVTFISTQGHFVLDNRGSIIFGELTRGFANWQNLKFGQRMMYEASIQWGPHCAVLCQHNVTIADARQVDTRHDIVAFQVMIYDFGKVYLKPFSGNEVWQSFVFHWFEDSLRMRRFLLGMSVGLKKVS